MTTQRKWIPEILKPFLRFIYYPQERAKVVREFTIRKVQNERIKFYDSSAQKLIVFLIEGADYFTGVDKISGGAISIVSLCEESKNLKYIHHSEVVLCTFPRQHLLAKYTQFKNDTDVFRFDQLRDYFRATTEVIVHLPEYLCGHFLMQIHNGELDWLKEVEQCNINVLNQNIRLMPSVEAITELRKCASMLTITTAHQQYCTAHFRALYQVPLHKLSVWISPEKYHFKSYNEKKNLMIVSPDDHSERSAVLEKLADVPGLQVQVIQNITYEQYKETIANAKWTLTFGEGLDGYLIEPIFSGAIAFAVYNSDFFTADFGTLSTIYDSMDVLKEKITLDLLGFDNESSFVDYQNTQFKLCASYYSQEEYKRNISAFYRKEYTYA